jgi:hypothetical protein
MKIEISFDEGALATIITNAVLEALRTQDSKNMAVMPDADEAAVAKAEKAAKAKAKREAKKALDEEIAAADAEAEAGEPAEANGVTLAQLRDLLRDFVGTHSRDEAKEILSQSDATSLSTLDEAQFETVAAKLAA